MFSSTYVYADDTNLGRTPEGVFPIQESDVIMESEVITVDLENKNVECIFVFHNTGLSKNIVMGFPGRINENVDSEQTEDVNLEISNFKTYVNGKELPVTQEETTQNNNESSDKLNYSEYFTFSIPFNADEKIMVRNTYNFTPTYDSVENVYGGYVLQTGAMWKGPIGSAKVIFKLGNIQPYQIERLQPGGFKFEGNELVWARNDFEPKYDLNLVYNTYYYGADFLKSAILDEVEVINRKIARYKNVNELADQGNTDELLILYNKAVSERNSVLALYIKSYLPPDKLSDEVATLGNISLESNPNYTDIKCDVIGPEDAFVDLKVSHIENDKVIQDMLLEDRSYDSVNLRPGEEYIITCTLTDWLDRTTQKTIKYKVPNKTEVLSEDSNTQPSDTESVSTTTDFDIETETINKPNNELKIKTSNESLSKPANEPIISKNNNYFIVWVLLGIILVGLSAVSVMIFLKKKNK